MATELRHETIAFARPKLSRSVLAVTLTLIGVVVVSSFFGRYALPVGGFRVRIEQLTPLLLTTWMLAIPSLRTVFLRTLRHPVVIVFAAFIAWNVISTLLFSPDYVWSVSILVWLVVDLLLLMSMMALQSGAALASRIGEGAVIPWSLLGFGAFAIANLTRGGFSAGTDFDWLYEIYVARLTAIEANIYASILILWALLSISRRNLPWSAAVVSAIAVPLGLVASQTRTSLVSLLLGLFVFGLYTLMRRESPFRGRLRQVAPAAILAAGLLLTFAVASIVPSAAESVSEEPGVVSSNGASADAVPSAPATSLATAATLPPDTQSTPAAAEPSEPPQDDIVPDPTNPDTQNKIGDFDIVGGTIGFRLTVAQLAAEDMKGLALWLGNGTNTFGIHHEQPGTPGVSGHIIMLPVQVLYDTGIVGLALLGTLIVAVFVKTPHGRKPVAAGLLTSYLISATLTSMFWFAVTWILFAALLQPEEEEDGVSYRG